MHRTVWYFVAGLLLIVGLRALLPHRLAETRSTEVLGLLNAELRGRPAGVALADLTSFAWDEACAVTPRLSAADLTAQTGIVVPGNAVPGGEGWLLVFARDKTAQATTRVPPSYGALVQDEPLRCVADTAAFLGVIETADAQGSPLRFVLKAASR